MIAALAASAFILLLVVRVIVWPFFREVQPLLAVGEQSQPDMDTVDRTLVLVPTVSGPNEELSVQAEGLVDMDENVRR